MAIVTVTGRVGRMDNSRVPASRMPRLWAVPVQSTAFGDALLTDDEVSLNLDPETGQFSGQLNNAPGIRYTIWMDRLIPGQESEAPPNRARDWVQWSKPFHPGDGGDIGDLVPVDFVGLIWIGENPPPGGPGYRPGTRWLVSDPSSPNFGWIVKWS